MKILFGIQATGNGHITRSTEIYKLLKQNPAITQLDILISGGKAKMSLPFEVNYEYKGLSFYYGKKGKISILKSIGKANFLSISIALMKVPFREYDLIISDFEPITLWGAKIAGVPAVGIGNMYSMSSKNFPKVGGSSKATKFITKMVCPAKNKIGMHFQKFDDNIFYPVIRGEIRNAPVADKNFTLVYLNSYTDESIVKVLTQPEFRHKKFIVYSNKAEGITAQGNCIIEPLNNDTFTADMLNCSGVITAGGFQTISEALYLGKKLFVIPIKKQFEQNANARILEQMGVTTCKELNADCIEKWLRSPNTVQVKFDDDLQNIVNAILKTPLHRRGNRLAA
jgi:uncharacterized protein (TIGR00661 family)